MNMINYKSELINKILGERGHEMSTLHYESECIETWIDEAKGAYPKLTDYESEWMNYITQNPVGEFPYETITDVTDATVDNVVPYAYKSAILKGNILVNIFDNWVNNVGTLTPVQTQDGYFLFTGSNRYAKVNLDDIPTFKRGVEYTFIYRIKNSTYDGENNNSLRLEVGATTIDAHTVINGIWKIKKSFSTDETNCFVKILSWVSSTGSAEVSLQIIEGDYTNVDIPYFVGIQSVKMPVLTTTGKNLFDGKLELGAIVSSTGANTTATDTVRSVGYIKVKSNTSIVLSNDLKYSNKIIYEYDSNKEFIGRKTTNPFTTSPNCHYIRFRSDANQPNLDVKYQIEYGTAATPYEPYKSNILTVNEEVTLRSNGNICDELNLLTGQLTQRIDEDGEVLSQEVVKTVDLSVIDQDGKTLSQIKPLEGTMHISTDGTPLKPTVSMEIPVEAITQNLSSFIEE